MISSSGSQSLVLQTELIEDPPERRRSSRRPGPVGMVDEGVAVGAAPSVVDGTPRILLGLRIGAVVGEVGLQRPLHAQLPLADPVLEPGVDAAELQTLE